MDNRITIALLILLLAVSSLHLVFSKHFQHPPSRESTELGLFLPQAFAQRTAQAAQREGESDEGLRLGFARVEIGSSVLYKNHFGCLYTHSQLNQILSHPDRYCAEMRAFLNR